MPKNNQTKKLKCGYKRLPLGQRSDGKVFIDS